MKRSQFVLALIAAVSSVGADQHARACDCCDNQGQSRCCHHTDNRGLLDVLNSAVGKLQPQMPKLSMPKLGILGGKNRSTKCGCDQRPSCGCETAPSCGCESLPSCGCESQPNCGCETAPSCGCEASPFHGYDAVPAYQHIESAPSYSAPAQPSHLYQEPVRPPVKVNAAPFDQNPPHYREFQSVPGPAIPSPPVPLPLPDAEVDPFRDDQASRLRRIPARTIQHRKPASEYSQSYDPQASNTIHKSLSDQMTAPVQQTYFDTASSSRTRRSTAAVQSSFSDRTEPVVVTASGQAAGAQNNELQPGRSRTVARPAPGAGSNYSNPLRGR